jgi:hypothetical protein
MGMQELRENTLIERLKETIRSNPHPTGEYAWHQQTASLPVTIEDVAQEEVQLGFELPALLRRLLVNVLPSEQVWPSDVSTCPPM